MKWFQYLKYVTLVVLHQYWTELYWLQGGSGGSGLDLNTLTVKRRALKQQCDMLIWGAEGLQLVLTKTSQHTDGPTHHREQQEADSSDGY